MAQKTVSEIRSPAVPILIASFMVLLAFMALAQVKPANTNPLNPPLFKPPLVYYDSGGYFTFSGSLTTPPCSEGVTWFVLKEPVAISAAEMEQFAKLYPNNARPTQPLYDRVVFETK